MAKLEAKARAVLQLATGETKAETARQVGVHPSTVTAWLTEPQFVAEVEVLRKVAAATPVDGLVLMNAAMGARKRILAAGARPARSGVRVRIPADASPEQARRIVLRAVARRIVSRTRSRR